MGMPECITDIVPFVTRIPFKGSDFDDETKYLKERAVLEPWGDNPELKTEINGWELFSRDVKNIPGFPNMPDLIYYGQDGEIYCGTYWKKGDMIVFPHNQDQYESVGGFDFCLMADTKEAIQTFSNEVLLTLFPNFKPKIKVDSIVKWWV